MTAAEVANLATLTQEEVNDTTGTDTSYRGEMTDTEILIDATNTEVFMTTHLLTLCSQQVHS
jgi:hypothetical protein